MAVERSGGTAAEAWPLRGAGCGMLGVAGGGVGDAGPCGPPARASHPRVVGRCVCGAGGGGRWAVGGRRSAVGSQCAGPPAHVVEWGVLVWELP